MNSIIPAFFNKFKGDKIIWRIIGILVGISVLAVYSSTGTLAYKYQSGNTFHYFVKHFSLLLVGVGITYFVHMMNYKIFFRLAKLFLFMTIPLLLFTLLLGVNLNSASRWITIPGIGLSFQSSDFAKLSLIIFIAQILSKNQQNPGDYKKVLIPVLFTVFVICGLVFPANFSTSALLFCISVVMMFIGRIPIKQLFVVFVSIAIVLSSLGVLIFNSPDIFPRGATWKKRIETFLGGDEVDSDSSYQSDQAKIAIATGGVFGKGPGNSAQRNFLPHPYSDFIFAIIVEEYGLLGGIVTLSLYLFLLYRSGVIARKCEYAFPAILAAGLSFSLVFQAMVNMAVAVNLFPVTGQTLPLVSMGGTSIFFTSIALGIILSVSRIAEKHVVNKKDDPSDNSIQAESDDEMESEGMVKQKIKQSNNSDGFDNVAVQAE